MSHQPGYDTYISHLTDLITTFPPPFIYVHDPIAPQTTASVTASTISSIAASSSNPPISYACVNAVACFTARLVYDTVLNKLANWSPAWEDGCQLWGVEGSQRWNDSVDGFLHGLGAVHKELVKKQTGTATSASIGKGKAGTNDPRIVIVIERAERLKTTLPDLIVPLTRLAELVSRKSMLNLNAGIILIITQAQLDLTVIMVSDVPWVDIKPPLGASPDPFYMDISAPNKQGIVSTLPAAYWTYSYFDSQRLYRY